MPQSRYEKIISARWIITVETDGEVLENHAVAIRGGKIAAILPAADAAALEADERLELPDHVLMPGLINLHGHSAMSLLRGLADDKVLMDWLTNYIWPTEGKHVRDDFVFDGSLLAMGEMIRGGTTTINDMYFYNAAMARAGLASGMRTFVGCSILEFPTNYASTADDYIAKGMAERSQFLGEELITFTLAPHAPYTVSDDTFRKVVTLAEQEDMLIHCHIHETAEEVNNSVKERGMRPLARLQQLGLLSPRLVAAHMVHLNDAEIELVAKHGLSTAHNPASNMKLASGIAPVSKLLDAGVAVGIGTDGAASNNKLDMLAETRLAALLAKVGTLDPTSVPAAAAIRMATLNGARALGIADKVGSVKEGKDADLIAIDLAALETAPAFDPISHVVYAAGREQVSHVWVKGRALMRDRKLATLDESNLKARADDWRNRILAK
ncbi:TRZ/ATZ family hydrolase [Chromobacterium phragmitis]|uniref:5-methylthioadenosine/S-adenosylhomocysteine deaminase n=1 Tax=Chromobacterium phragmitis TaxID=2202141 RepID=A0A344ULA4_9NEIS|nr:TRZ/ATZ family hydrolase [Chromobacterium phragmitis]AXE30681.1 TRZ/ATZ family hydrolase [Chromobacterium phragmitis]AXE36052.1 TRZ/ATZ family hydrolase [Chromobacterium phragmitis]